MSQAYDRVYNFSAGPGTLPVEVLEQARDEMLNWHGTGMSVMEMSHRSKPFESILEGTEQDLRTLMGIPDNYRVLFLQGGASLQFTMVAMNFLPKDGVADYVLTGAWGKKAMQAAQLQGDVNVVFDAKATGYDHAPLPHTLTFDGKAAYLHITSNETIHGVDFLRDPSVDLPVICDMSSNILSRPMDVTRYAVIYAGAQKNLGPAGVSVVIARDDMLEKVPQGLPPMLDYRLQSENKSMYNTPPCYSIYICGLGFKHLLKTGGVEAAAKRNEEKAKIVYDAIDGSGGFYKGHAQVNSRSRMNIPFTLPSEELTVEFLKGAKERGMLELKGHRSVGGCRASVYNAFPKEGCLALAQFMKEFAAKNG